MFSEAGYAANLYLVMPESRDIPDGCSIAELFEGYVKFYYITLACGDKNI